MVQYNPLELEARILKFWKDNNLFEKSMGLRKGKRFSFLDGPPTANNPMGVHHSWGRTYKDLFLRFRTMQGFETRKQPGFDCQGLWVEVGVEKELGFKTKKDIESYGLGKFSEKCKENVLNYVKIWIELSEKLGMWMDWNNPYLTLTDTNIEYVWYFLKKCSEKKWLYKGNKALAWCPRCETSLSQHEVASGYKDLKHKAIFVKFPIKGKEKEFLLIYTTTAWTLPADVAAAVHPDLTYVKVRQGDETYILCKNLLSVLMDKYETIEEIPGKNLDGMEFIAPLQELPVQKDIKHRVILSDIVSSEEGTGIVHIAPGHGPEDFELGKKYNLPIISPIDERGIFDSSAGWLQGKTTKEANEMVMKFLEDKGLLYKTIEITHSYPCCWRCSEELVYRTGEEWFIKTEEIRPKLIEEIKKVKFYPEWTQKSMLDWLANLKDWNISRKRYFGLPLPFWYCENGHLEVIGRRKELEKKAISGLEQLKELHRPWIDNVIIKCPKCGGEMKRVLETGDCWLDAGVVPFSTLKYFEDRNYWEKWFPADFITEMHEQVRLWFYSMLFISIALEGKAPYKSVLAHGMVLDEKGREMHKSSGNAIWADEALSKIGADLMRWMYACQNPALPLPFGYTPAREVRRILDILYNTAKYVETYCEANKYKPVKPKKYDLASRWIISRIESLKENVMNYLDDLQPHLAARELQEFFLNDFSRFYIHIIRQKVKPGFESKEKDMTLYTLYKVMLDLLKLLSPFIPFITESLYQDYFKKFEKKESIHFTDWPFANNKLIDKKLEERMEVAKKIIDSCYAVRQKTNIKLRWPIRQVLVMSSDKNVSQTVKQLKAILLQMCNSKIINLVMKVPKGEFSELDFDFGKILIDKKLDENLLEEAMVRELVREIQDLRKKNGFQVSEKIHLCLSSDEETNKKLKKYEKIIAKEVGAKKVNLGKLEGNFKGSIQFEKVHIDVAFDRLD